MGLMSLFLLSGCCGMCVFYVIVFFGYVININMFFLESVLC